MDMLKDATRNLKSIGVGSGVPELRDQLFDMVSPDQEAKEREMRRMIEEESLKRSLSGNTKAMKKGGKVSGSASKRADGCAQRGKTKGKFV